MGVSKNSGTPESSISIGFSIGNHPFWCTPIFGNTHILHHYQVDLSFLKIFGIPDVCICFNGKLEICRFLRLMQFVLQLFGHGETWSFKI